MDDKWERKIRREFEEYTNNDSKDYSCKKFSIDEQINRYSKALAFWNIKLFNCTSNEQYMFNASRHETYIRIQQTFTKSDQLKIVQKANELASNFKKIMNL